MRKVRNLPLVLVAFLFTLLGASAQHNGEQYITITKMHRNLNFTEASFDKWAELEVDYLNQVVKKNDYILNRYVLQHYMTENNTEVLFIQTYKNMEDIEKAEKRSIQLENESGPEMKMYFEYINQYFTEKQSVEIFNTVPGMKEDLSIIDKSLFYQMRVNHLALPKEGIDDTFLKLNDEFLKKAIDNNKFIVAYYPFIHVSGSDNRHYVEITAVESLDDLEKAFIEIDEFLYEPQPEDKENHNIFLNKYFKYFNGFHEDYIYKSVPQLQK